MAQVPGTPPDTMAQAPIDPVFRNGTVTVIGVIAGFSLSFITGWATAPYSWQVHDLVSLFPLLAGVLCELIGMSILLYPESLERRRYNRAIRLFLAGLGLVFLGGAIAIGGDALFFTSHH